ncbi:MAG TPA: hypothetical protein VHU22_20680 [Xanthobacteraceae bacterium]|jgi:hypothetical protein|nr:hypothetical protein [Xanthobacteraceae bacterium]
MAPRRIAETYCKQYGTNATFFIDERQPAGRRLLIVKYEKGGFEGKKEFIAGIPDEWTEQEVLNFLLWPMKHPEAPYPAWEIPARAHGSPKLFRFWEDDKST